MIISEATKTRRETTLSEERELRGKKETVSLMVCLRLSRWPETNGKMTQ